jgi:hypothetical protein
VLRYPAFALTTSTQNILDAAMALPEDSIGDGRSEADIDAAWLVEVKRRLEAVRSGATTLIPTEEVERELEELIRDAPATRRAG